MKRLYGSAAAGLLVLLGFRIGGWLVLYLLIVAHHEPLLMRPGLQAGTLLGLLAGEVVLARVRSVRSVERCMVGLPRTRRSVGLGQGLRALIEWALVGAVFFGVVGHPFALSTIEALTLATGSLVVLAAPSADLWLFGDAPAPEQVFTPERVLAASLGFVALGLICPSSCAVCCSACWDGAPDRTSRKDCPSRSCPLDTQPPSVSSAPSRVPPPPRGLRWPAPP